MRTTLEIDDLLKMAASLTGIREKQTLVKMGLELLISKEKANKFILLGGTQKKLKTPRRRRN